MEIETPPPGIYEGVAFTDYLAWDAVSNTRLGQLAQSPKHYKANLALEPCRSLMIGQLVHCGRLEPLAIASRYAVMPDFEKDADNKTAKGEATNSKATSYYKNKVAEYHHVNGDKEIVSSQWYAETIAIVSALHADAKASECLNESGPVEVSILWDDPDTGIRCKARLDKVARSSQRIVDLKTTADIIKFTKAIANYGYHRQLAHYAQGWTALTGELCEPWIVAVENAAPYCVQAAPLQEEAFSEGIRQRRELLELLAECMETNNWPGPPAPDAWILPAWAFNNEPVELVVGGEKVTV